MPLTGRLWWRREAFWGVVLDGELLPPAVSVEIIGGSTRTAVKLDGGFSELPSGPAAIVEFEAQAVIVEHRTDTGLVVREYRTTEPANDNGEPQS